MIFFRIVTGFFIWDVYKWLMVFLIAALMAGLAISLAIRSRGGRLISSELRRGMEYSGLFSCEITVAALVKLAVEPWSGRPAVGLFGIALLVLFFYIAIFLR